MQPFTPSTKKYDKNKKNHTQMNKQLILNKAYDSISSTKTHQAHEILN